MKKTMKRLITAAMAIVMCVGCFALAAFATEGEPEIITGDINIGTAEELLAFAKSSQDGTYGNCKDLTVALTADIDLSGYYWYHRDSEGAVVADYRIPDFIGTFEGNGFRIRNVAFLDEYAEATEMSNLSFIIQGKSYLKNLHIDGITVNTAAPAYFAGLVKDFAWSGESTGFAENCSVSNVTVHAAADFTFGGMFYRLVGGDHITNCHVNNMTVHAAGALVGDNSGRNGGFVATGGEPMTLTNCSVKDLTVNAGSTSKYLGGFIGGASMSAKFVGCSVDGFTVNAADKISVLGGFAGYTAGSAWGSGLILENCFVKGLDVRCDAKITAAGGFIGYTYGQGKSLTDGAHNFTNCSAEGSIVAGAESKVGGFIGWLYGRSGGCAANFNNCAAAVNVTSGGYGAGFAGYFVPSGSNKMETAFVNCTASGDVSASEPMGAFLDADEATIDGITGGTYNYDPENTDEGEYNNVAPGYRALDNGDGTWTVFPDLGLEVVTIRFHRWNDETDTYEMFRAVEVFKDACFLNPEHDNENNATHPVYRFHNGLAALNDAAEAAERPFTFWTDAADGVGQEILTNSTVITADMDVYVALVELETEVTLGGSSYLDEALSDEFAFELLEGQEVLQQVSAENGKFHFAALRFEQAGVYTYQIREVVGNDEGILYDASVYTVIITVTQEGFELNASVEILLDEAVAEEIAFFNESVTVITPPEIPESLPKDGDSILPVALVMLAAVAMLGGCVTLKRKAV